MMGANIKRVAIMGATSHIAMNLIIRMCEKEHFQISLFARSSAKLALFLANNNISHRVIIEQFDHFQQIKFDVVINCIGIGDPGKLSGNISSIFSITETFDNLILNYLDTFSDVLYINFSSGAAYLNDFTKPATSITQTELIINNLTVGDYYGVSKINSEAKHRSLQHYNIVDLRVFGFFSRYMDLNSKFFLADVIRCLHADKILLTNSMNIVRDYINPQDLVALIEHIIAQHVINDVFDVYSLNPIAKFAILEYFSSEYGLKYRTIEDTDFSSTTGYKFNYYSINDHASTLGYKPTYDSLATIIEEYEGTPLVL
jgi:nucleoside-diphosphate-sugar epimerase